MSCTGFVITTERLVVRAAVQLEQLAQQFIGATAIANFAFWIALGLIASWAVKRIVASTGSESNSDKAANPEIKLPSI